MFINKIQNKYIFYQTKNNHKTNYVSQNKSKVLNVKGIKSKNF